MDGAFTMTLLISAIAIGAVLILIAMIMNIVTLFRKKDYVEMVFSHNGFAGLTLYGFIAVGIGLQMGLQIPVINGLTIALFVGIPLIAIFLKEPIEIVFPGFGFLC